MEGRCGRCDLALARGDGRYVVEIRVFAAPTLELDEEDLALDQQGELDRLGRELAALDPAEAEGDVHREFRFLLCRACQRAYVSLPLAPAPPRAQCARATDA